MTGKAYLIGAGPGRADLITVRGLNLLRQAQVVIYDRLIAPELLDEVAAGAERIFVGKETGYHCLPQTSINQLLVHWVRQDKQVVRLKGGDPFVFGRGGEEALALKQAGLPFEIVPGVSSSIAVPAYAGIPVTHRGLATAFAVVTGHEDSGKTESATDWTALAKIPTVVVLMGAAQAASICAALLAGGRAAETPAAAIHLGTRCQQQVVRATLSTLPQALIDHPLAPPVVIVVGEVVGLAEDLDWFIPESCEPTLSSSL
jgi:uroporphyrin-III C-methyltransferase